MADSHLSGLSVLWGLKTPHNRTTACPAGHQATGQQQDKQDTDGGLRR